MVSSVAHRVTVNLPISGVSMSLILWVQEHLPNCPSTGEEGSQTLLQREREGYKCITTTTCCSLKGAIKFSTKIDKIVTMLPSSITDDMSFSCCHYRVQ